jgi:DNA mismatch endonuclease (patch repair protein)
MADLICKRARSKIMSGIKSYNTQPELFLKKSLKGYRYQPTIFGKPDFINYKEGIIIFVDGCFWHQCPLHSKMPKQNRAYWLPKLKRNVTRAKEVEIAYKTAGWKVIRIWEHDLKKLRNFPSFQKFT